jgi:hypothetical protein
MKNSLQHLFFSMVDAAIILGLASLVAIIGFLMWTLVTMALTSVFDFFGVAISMVVAFLGVAFVSLTVFIYGTSR